MAATDAELVEACLAGHSEVFGELVERYRDAVYGLCYARLGNFELAKDLTQEAFVSAYRALRQLREPERFAAWLRRIADNACKAERRRRLAPEQASDSKPLAISSDVADEVSIRLTVQAALRSLPENQRVAISLFYINGYTCDEIGKFLSLPPSTVKGRLRNGRAKLRDHLAEAVQGFFLEKALPANFGGRIMQLIRNVELREQDANPVMLLVDDGDKAMPIWIGEAEARSLYVALGDRQPPRPLTYDLFLRALSAFGICLERVEVVEARENTIFATMLLRKGKKRESLDARPSDAVNMAMRAKVPIMVSDALAEKMMERAQAEQDMSEFSPDTMWIEQAIRGMLQRAVREGAARISVSASRKNSHEVPVYFVAGRQRVEFAALPPHVMPLLRERLAEMAHIRLKPGAKRQSGRIHVRFENKDHEFKLTMTPTGVTLKPASESK